MYQIKNNSSKEDVFIEQSKKPILYSIKQKLEDFQVIEIPNRTFSEEGPYSVWRLTKTNYNTEDAIQTLIRALKIQRKQISYAGTKDKQAITTQYITITNSTKEHIQRIELKDIELKYEGQTKTPLSLGDLNGNKFVITIRNLSDEDVTAFRLPTDRPLLVPNYFGEQRFQKNNSEIGKLLVKKKFKEVVDLLKEDFQYGEKLKEYSEKYNGDSINALRQIPKKILSIYVHAYQSKLWNETVEKLLKDNPEQKQIEIPLIGFGMELENKKIQTIIEEIMKKEEINERDFIIREFPEISAQGGDRKLFSEITNFKTSELKKDEINPEKYKIILEFELGKGSYATTVLKHIFS